MKLNLSKGQLITGGIAAAGAVTSKLLKGLDSSGTEPAGQNQSYIWKFVEHASIYDSEETDCANRKRGYGPAPDLAGVSQQPGSNTIQHVDVINDHAWTQSPKTARWDVPTLMLREKRIQVNPQINQIANNLFVATEKTGRGVEQILDNETPQQLLEKIKQNEANPENEFGKKILQGWKTVGETADQLASGSGVMAPYDDLYYTKDTGFVYSLPYSQEKSRTIQNSFGGDEGMGLLNMAANLTETAAGLAKSLNLADPGSYIEQPKLFKFTGRENSYTLEFPLINTGSFRDVIKNWQLLFLLTYQNSPNRLTRDLIDPPCIYEANLDGTWYAKYAYIANMTVSFVGATRKMTIPVPTEVKDDGSGDKSQEQFNVETIIPDMYKVNMTVTEIFGETQNSMFTSINQQNRQVTVQRSTIEDTTPDAVKQGLAPFRKIG